MAVNGMIVSFLAFFLAVVKQVGLCFLTVDDVSKPPRSFLVAYRMELGLHGLE